MKFRAGKLTWRCSVQRPFAFLCVNLERLRALWRWIRHVVVASWDYDFVMPCSQTDETAIQCRQWKFAIVHHGFVSTYFCYDKCLLFADFSTYFYMFWAQQWFSGAYLCARCPAGWCNAPSCAFVCWCSKENSCGTFLVYKICTVHCIELFAGLYFIPMLSFSSFRLWHKT